MTSTDKVQELTESSTSLPSPVMTDSEVQVKEYSIDNKEEAIAILTATEDDAVDEMNIKSAQDLSQVISALQGTVIANIPSGKEEVIIPQEQEIEQLEPNDIVLDTIHEDELDSSLINGDSPIKADIDIPLNDISAPSEPDSPRPKPSDLNIATDFEKIVTSIDVPAGQNMADFVTPPTPGLAPSSLLGSEDDDNDDDLPKRSSNEQNITNIATIDAAVGAATVAASEIKPSPTNAITLSKIDFNAVRPNFLSPRAQEKYGKKENNKKKESY